jgi:hypothetical protein
MAVKRAIIIFCCTHRHDASMRAILVCAGWMTTTSCAMRQFANSVRVCVSGHFPFVIEANDR